MPISNNSQNPGSSLIPVYRPDLSGNEKAYVIDCLDTEWISSIGIYTEKFESYFSNYVGCGHAISVSNGTVALHLALHCLDIGPGDEVIVPTFTYIASVNTIRQTGATPVFVECNLDDWLIDIADVERKITSRTKAIVAVHLYGAVCDMLALRRIADAHRLSIVEDCAEALGSTLDDQHVGTFGDVGTFSFFGNKTVTTGEGGMVIANDKALADRLRKVKGQGQSLDRRYWHDELGFNYRMTNICAAIGLAQMERIDAILFRKRQIGALYRQLLQDCPVHFQHIQDNVVSSDWLVSLLLPSKSDRDTLMKSMRNRNIDSRPVFYCAHQMPMYDCGLAYPVSEHIAKSGISLPSYPALSDDDVAKVVDVLKSCAGFQ
ncbi:DegT/DnrJ/EryC1/StrS aminotransferase family protein [Sphingobium algorifonticola]|uniref:GDP-perosamine synthase n=2 Tax=Sphingobium algorifonticola TaxID=2008318 RepID=A0A437J537_9SPHN|nr:DegT/DnrJ/EryC1/StrS aminotransferase family protein [Sphingobium algorifonticola]